MLLAGHNKLAQEHSDLGMTLRYSHTGLDSKRKAVESLTGHILSMTGCGFLTQVRHESGCYFVCIVCQNIYRKIVITPN